MNENNYTKLVEQLDSMGFGRDASMQLLNQMYSDQPQICMLHQVYYGNDKVQALLQFCKSEETGMYLLNNYKLNVLRERSSEVIKHTIHISSTDNNITLKEAYNLVNGRALYKELSSKEGEKKGTWIQLDFKETDAENNFKLKTHLKNNEFDLAEILSKYPIKEMFNEEDKKWLIQSLEGGNKPSVTYITGNRERKLFIEAAPQFNSIKIFDADMRRLKQEQLSSETHQETTVDQIQRKTQYQDNTGHAGDTKIRIQSKLKM